MRRCLSVYRICAAVGVGWLALGAGPAPDSSGGNEATLERTIARLGSAVYGEREAAQRELEKVPLEQFETLKRIAETAADAEVKARVAQRVEAMELMRVLRPPGFTLEMKDATMAQVVAEMNRQVEGGKLLAEPTPAQQGIRFSLQLRDASLMEVVAEMGKQSPVMLGASSTALNPDAPPLRLLQGSPTSVRPTAVSGCFMMSGSVSAGGVVAQVVRPTRVVLSMITDPRVKVVQYSTPRILEARDDVGTDMVETGAADAGLRPLTGTQRSSMSFVVTTGPAAAAATKIAVLKGEVRLGVVLEEGVIEVKDLEKKLNVPIETPEGTLKVETLERAPTGLMVRVSLAMARGRGVAVDRAKSMMLRIVDSEGHAVANVSIGMNGILSTSARVVPAAGPLKGEIRYAVRTAEVTMPFELKDLPLGARPAAIGGAVLVR